MKDIPESSGVEKAQEQPKAKSARGKKRAKTVMKVIIHVLAVSALVGLSVALAFTQEKVQYEARYREQMEAVYSRSYHQLLDGADNLDVNLAKLSVASSVDEQQVLLSELWNTSTLTSSALERFAFEGGDGVEAATKFVNQLGDYSRTCSTKLAEGETLDAEDSKNFASMREMATVFKTALDNVGGDLSEGLRFSNEDGLSVFSQAFADFVSPSVSYPEMIYDGPFSDALKKRDTKYLNTFDEISLEDATKAANAVDGFSNAEYVSDGSGDILTYNFEGEYGERHAFVCVSKYGGQIVSMHASSIEGETQFTEEQCIAKALEFATSVGYASLECVWSCAADGACFVNLAPIEDGVILYPDLVKVKISAADGNVMGFDASHYCFNHTSRDLPTPSLSSAQAEDTLKVDARDDGRLCLIPMQGTREILCYEFVHVSDGTYYIYVNALNGREQNILYVVDSVEEGSKLI